MLTDGRAGCPAHVVTALRPERAADGVLRKANCACRAAAVNASPLPTTGVPSRQSLCRGLSARPPAKRRHTRRASQHAAIQSAMSGHLWEHRRASQRGWSPFVTANHPEHGYICHRLICRVHWEKSTVITSSVHKCIVSHSGVSCDVLGRMPHPRQDRHLVRSLQAAFPGKEEGGIHGAPEAARFPRSPQGDPCPAAGPIAAKGRPQGRRPWHLRLRDTAASRPLPPR